ncbi:MAG TPA: type 1 glutamine amidotransferase domain-containing protein [Puia sp.]|nr:type 1 glutamine amidotransferase domain-containing protein [Puia sp.]
MKILIIATSHEQLGNTGRKTGCWLEEVAIPYYIFKEAGATITLASPKGGPIPLDPKSESIIVSTAAIRRFQKDPEAITFLAHSISLDTHLSAENFDMLFITGGHGPLWDFPESHPLRQLIEEFSRQQKVIGAVCHGVSALVSTKNELGEMLVKGRNLTAFSNSEENSSGLKEENLPFLLESNLVALGAHYSKSADYTSHTVTDGNLITGQNSASAREVARKMLVLLKELPDKAPTPAQLN